jgi:uroporphyrinogen III methyltransferase/synthase
MIAHKPLSGWRVLVTRPAEQARALVEALDAAGASPILFPVIELRPPPSWTSFDEAVARIDSYAWVVFTSPSAVRFAFGRALDLGERLRPGGAPAVAAVGTETARALAGHGVSVALVPADQRQEGLVAAFSAMPSGTRFLFPQTIGGRDLLRDTLATRGAVVDVVAVSETAALPLDSPPPAFDIATFASPSALRAFVVAFTAAALVGKIVAVIGPTTLDAARAAGVRVHVIPAAPSVEALVTALSTYLGQPEID